MISETALNRELGAGVEIGPFRPFPVLSDGPWRGDPSPGMVDYRREERRQAPGVNLKGSVGSNGRLGWMGRTGLGRGRETTGPPNTRV